MADLSTMFNQLGPAGGSILAGVQMGNEANAARAEEALRKAQMDKIIEETNQAKLMNPLELEAKQQSVKSGALKAKAEEHAYNTKVLGDAIPELEKVPNGPGQRVAYLQEYAAKRGVPMSPEDIQHYANQPDLLGTLKKQHEWSVTQDQHYRQAMDVAEMQRKSAEKIAAGHDAATRYGVDQRANAAAAKNKGIASIQENVRSGKMTAEKAAVALFGAAQFETDPVAKQQYEDMARQYEQFAMNQRNASAQGRVDVGAAANLPTQTLPPALGGPGAGPAPTANPNRKPLSDY